MASTTREGIDLACLSGFNATWDHIFERQFCLRAITDFLQHSPNITTSPACMKSLFVDGLNTSPEDPLLTSQGCKALCGPNWGYYPDSMSRVAEWVVPVVLLLGNINLSAVERKTLMGITHTLGDPIDTLWSLLDKLYAWHVCHKVARRAVEGARLRRSVSGGPRIHHAFQPSASDNSASGAHADKEKEPKDGSGDRSVQINVIPLDYRSGSHPDSLFAPTQPMAVVPTPEERIRIIATVLGALEELAGPLITDPVAFYTSMIAKLGDPASESTTLVSQEVTFNTNIFATSTSNSDGNGNDSYGNHNSNNTGRDNAIDKWHTAALSLVDGRTNEFLRTWMAVLLYFFQLASEFIDQISQNSESTPGGRIGAAMMLSFLIPVALVSNLLGGFPSRRSNLKAVLDLVRETTTPFASPSQPEDESGGRRRRRRRRRSSLSRRSSLGTRSSLRRKSSHLQHPMFTTSTGFRSSGGPRSRSGPAIPGRPFLNRSSRPTSTSTSTSIRSDPFSSWTAHFKSQPHTGAIYGFRPFKSHTISQARGADRVIRLLLPLVSTLPVISAFLASFILHWEAVPVGFSCRHVWIITVFCLWIISPFITFFSWHFIGRRDRTTAMWVIYIKDLFIGLGTLVMIIASVIGVFNSCFCWSLAMWVGEGSAIMVVNTKSKYLAYKRRLYPSLVGGFILFQVVFVGVVVWLLWTGLGVMRWGEQLKRKGWDRLRGDEELRGLYEVLASSAAVPREERNGTQV